MSHTKGPSILLVYGKIVRLREYSLVGYTSKRETFLVCDTDDGVATALEWSFAEGEVAVDGDVP